MAVTVFSGATRQSPRWARRRVRQPSAPLTDLEPGGDAEMVARVEGRVLGIRTIEHQPRWPPPCRHGPRCSRGSPGSPSVSIAGACRPDGQVTAGSAAVRIGVGRPVAGGAASDGAARLRVRVEVAHDDPGVRRRRAVQPGQELGAWSSRSAASSANVVEGGSRRPGRGPARQRDDRPVRRAVEAQVEALHPLSRPAARGRAGCCRIPAARPSRGTAVAPLPAAPISRSCCIT